MIHLHENFLQLNDFEQVSLYISRTLSSFLSNGIISCNWKIKLQVVINENKPVFISMKQITNTGILPCSTMFKDNPVNYIVHSEKYGLQDT